MIISSSCIIIRYFPTFSFLFRQAFDIYKMVAVSVSGLWFLLFSLSFKGVANIRLRIFKTFCWTFLQLLEYLCKLYPPVCLSALKCKQYLHRLLLNWTIIKQCEQSNNIRNYCWKLLLASSFDCHNIVFFF